MMTVYATKFITADKENALHYKQGKIYTTDMYILNASNIAYENLTGTLPEIIVTYKNEGMEENATVRLSLNEWSVNVLLGVK